MGKFPLQAAVDRSLYFQFRDLIRAHGLTLTQGTEWALRNLLVQAGVKLARTTDEQEKRR
jgi:hypothetical protein